MVDTKTLQNLHRGNTKHQSDTLTNGRRCFVIMICNPSIRCKLNQISKNKRGQCLKNCRNERAYTTSPELLEKRFVQRPEQRVLVTTANALRERLPDFDCQRLCRSIRVDGPDILGV